MGKCGAGELNYISDVDVIYVHESVAADEDSASRIAAALATGIARALGTHAAEPALWEVDANLRPEGKEGVLSRTLESHLAYYRRWAQSWEFQALLKARPDRRRPELGAAYEAAVAPLMWSSSEREGFVESVQAMRRRVTENIPAQEVARQLKLGPGGLRDVEFTVQLLQLVHGAGRRDPPAPRHHLGDRRAEHRRLHRPLRRERIRRGLPLPEGAGAPDPACQLRRTHLMPVKEDALRALAKSSLGPSVAVRPSAEKLTGEWQHTKRGVRLAPRAHLLPPAAGHRGPPEHRRGPPQPGSRPGAAGGARLRDPRGAMRHIEALTAGVSRRAALQRQLLPVLLGWIAEGVDPDAGLLGFRRLSESLGESHWYLGMLRDSSAAAERLCHILSNSRFITDLMEVSPESAAWLGDGQDWRRCRSSAVAGNHRRSEPPPRAPPGDAADPADPPPRMLRIALADGAGVIDRTRSAGRCPRRTGRPSSGPCGSPRIRVSPTARSSTDLLVVAMGRQGGREIGYCSDADVMFVHRPLPGADSQAAQEQALRICSRLGALLGQPLQPAVLAEPRLEVDADLRPEGRQGPLVRSLEAYREYYGRWALVWEVQALLRARPMAGDETLGRDFMELVDSVRYRGGLEENDVREIRRIKARVEAERLPRGADPARHLKLGRGALSDVEWLVQLLQLRHAAGHPALRTTSTRPALRALGEEGLLPPGDVELLDRAWVLAARVRSAIVVCTGRPSDVLPSSRRDLEAVARWCGYPAGQAAHLEEDYLKTTRRARQVFERHFYGFDG